MRPGFRNVLALTMSPLTTLIMTSVPLGKAGVGSAMNDTTRELGGALGVAVLGSLVTSTYTSQLGPSLTGLPTAARTAADSGLAGALQVAERMGAAGNPLADAAKLAFVDGLGVAALVGAIVVLGAATLSWFLLPSGLGVPATSGRIDVGPVGSDPVAAAVPGADVVLTPIPASASSAHDGITEAAAAPGERRLPEGPLVDGGVNPAVID